MNLDRAELCFVAVVVLFCCDSSWGASSRQQPRTGVALYIHSFESCENVQQYIHVKSFTSERAKSGVSYSNGEFVNDKLLKSMSVMVINATSCREAVSFNTCENLGNYRFSVGLCALMVSDTMPWSSYTRKVQPPIGCPLSAGTYVMKNGTLNAGALQRLGPSLASDWINKVGFAELRISNEKRELHMCFYTKFQFVRIRLS